MSVIQEDTVSEAVEVANSAIQKYGGVVENHTEHTIRKFAGVPSVSEVQDRIDSVDSATDEISTSKNHRKVNKLINELYYLKSEVQND
jgi:hypothetical protein